jgi:hypothetical protein
MCPPCGEGGYIGAPLQNPSLSYFFDRNLVSSYPEKMEPPGLQVDV